MGEKQWPKKEEREKERSVSVNNGQVNLGQYTQIESTYNIHDHLHIKPLPPLQQQNESIFKIPR